MRAYPKSAEIDKAVDLFNGFSAEDPAESANLCKLLQSFSSESGLSADDAGKITQMIKLHACGEN